MSDPMPGMDPSVEADLHKLQRDTFESAVERTLATLRFFWNSPQGPEPDATGYRGFYYHFLDMQTGRRAWQCELSTVYSGFLLAGALTAAIYGTSDWTRDRSS